MRIKSLIILFGAIIFTFIIAPCSFNQYQPNKIITIQAKFPTRNSLNPKINHRPAGAPENYVPPFVDRIEMHLTGTDSSGQPIIKNVIFNRSDNNFTAPYTIPDIPYGRDFILSVNAYSYNGILTHTGSVPIGNIGSGYSKDSISVNFDIQSETALDDQPVKIQHSVTSQSPPDIDYCIDINNDGDVAFTIKQESDSILRYSIFAFNETVPQLLFYTTDTPNFDQTCKFIDGKLQVPLIQNISDSNRTLSRVVLEKTGGTWVPTKFPIRQLSESGGGYSNIKIDSYDRKIVLVWDQDESLQIKNPYYTYFQTFHDDFISYFDDPKQFCSMCAYPLVKIIDDDQFAIFSNYASGTISKALGKLYTMNGEEYELGSQPKEFLDVVQTNGAGNILNYSFTQAIYNHPFVLTFEGKFTDPTKIQYLLLESDLKPQPSDPSLLIAPKNPEYEQRYPMTLNIRNQDIITVYSEGHNENPTEFYDIYYFLSESQPPVSIQVSDSDDNYDKGTPKIAINDDGLAVISWYSTDGNFYFKRYLF